MKNKKLTYILLPVVIGIWAYLFYSFFLKLKGSDDNIVFKKDFIPSLTLEKLAVDTFSIEPNYRDPFLDKSAEVQKTVKTTPANVIVTKNTGMGWPKLVYSGIIKNQTGNKQLALIQINGKQNRIQLNQIIDGVSITKITRDSILVKFGKESRWIRR